MYNYELYHHGILGQKWGVRRFQNTDGSLTPAGQKRYDDDPTNDGADDAAARKKRVIETGDVKEAYANRSQYTDKELQAVINRYNVEQQIKTLSQKDVVTGRDKVNKITDAMATGVRLTSQGMALYNNLAKISNSLTGTELPIIDGNSKSLGEALKKKSKAVDKAVDAAKDTAEKTKAPDVDTTPDTPKGGNTMSKTDGPLTKYTSINTQSINTASTQSSKPKSISDYASYGKQTTDNSTKTSTTGPLSKYTSIDTKSVNTTPAQSSKPKSISDYASYGKQVVNNQKTSSNGPLSKYSSIDTSSVQAGKAKTESILNNFNYKFTDKDKK